MMITVFLADDHTVVREGLKYLLEAEPDIEVIGGASTGYEAVKQVEELNPDVVVMDIAMPGLNGIEAAQRICKMKPSPQVIMLSMYGTNEHIFQAFQVGASGFLLKESAGYEVVNAVRTAKAGKRYLSKKISEIVIEEYFVEREKKTSDSPLSTLSPREREVLQHVVEGKSSVEISNILFLSPKTVETYRSRLMKKLKIEDIPSLVRFALKEGIIDLE
jgi:DNA-binding NarL/FixJ family response regulator